MGLETPRPRGDCRVSNECSDLVVCEVRLLLPTSPWGANPMAGMKPTLVRPEETLRLGCIAVMLCALTQSAKPPCT